MTNRRKFIKDSSRIAAGGILLSGFSPSAFAGTVKRVNASDQIQIAAIGINGMGWADTKAALKGPGVYFVACEWVDKNVLD